jgi:hypothetical protein
MLSDPLYLGVPVTFPVTNSGTLDSNVTSAFVVHNVGGGVGSSRRTGIDPTMAGSVPATFTISHSETKENAPYVTGRSLIRLDLTKVDAVGKEVTMSVYAVIALPQCSLFSVADCARQVRTLGLFLLAGPSSNASDFAGILGDDTITRIINGEP